MEETMSELKKLIHGEGPSRITMDSNNQIVSCGRDSTSIVFHNGDLEDDTYQFDVEGASSVCDIACYRQDGAYMIAVATDDHNVLSYSYCSGNTNNDLFAESKFNTVLLRFTATINTLDVNVNDTLLAAGSSDFTVKMVDLTDPVKVSTIEGHDGPILCVKFDPLNIYLASSSCDGTIKLWSIENKMQAHSINVFPKTNDVMFVSTLCRLSWQPTKGQVLAVPTDAGTKIFDRNSWKCLNTIKDKTSDDKSDHVVVWSPCGHYMAIGGSDGVVSIWAWPQCTKTWSNDSDVGIISSLYWDVKGTSSLYPLLFSSSSGYIGSYSRQWAYPSKNAPPPSPPPLNEDNPLIDDSLLMEGIPADSIFDDFDDFDDDDLAAANGDDVNQLKRGNERHNGDGDGDGDGSLGGAPPAKKLHMASSGCDTRLAPPTNAHHMTSDDDDSDSVTKLAPPIEMTSTNQIKEITSVKLPEAHYHEIFQPSATPSHLTHRFMVYNLVGVVRCHDDDTSSMIEVEFHNSSTHHPFSIPNQSGWTMAALSAKALLLAVESVDDEQSQLQCTVFESWDHIKDWNVQLADGENIEVVAIGDEWVAVATSMNFIRLFTLGGLQREVISYVGQIVTLNGRGDNLIIVYQETTSSSLSVWILNVMERSQVCPPHPLPLSPTSKLDWIGFSEGGIPVSYDTKGIIRVLSRQYGLSWLPVLNTTGALSQKGDRYFMLGMTHNPNEIRVILCKGMDYPPVQPRPIMSTLPLFIPLCDPKTERTDLESQYLEQLLVCPLGSAPSSTDLLKHEMKLIALACRSQQEYKAFEIANMITLDQGLELSLQYASQSGHFRLARKISNLKEQRLASREEGEDEGDDDDGVGDDDEREIRSIPTQHKSYLRHMRTDTSARRTLIAAPEPNDKENRHMADDNFEEEQETGRDIEENYSEENSIDEGSGKVEASLSASFSSPMTSKQKPLNPFKMATPLSKQIQVDRRSSFLDKICKDVEEEKDKQKKKSKVKPPSKSAVNKTKKKNESAGTNKLTKFSFVKKTT